MHAGYKKPPEVTGGNTLPASIGVYVRAAKGIGDRICWF